MKLYKVLKTFTGNQTGYGETQKFEQDAVVELSDSLAEIVLKDGLVEPHVTAETRETKVEEPEETKPTKGKRGQK